MKELTESLCQSYIISIKDCQKSLSSEKSYYSVSDVLVDSLFIVTLEKKLIISME
jgi:hypothetical protein